MPINTNNTTQIALIKNKLYVYAPMKRYLEEIDKSIIRTETRIEIGLWLERTIDKEWKHWRRHSGKERGVLAMLNPYSLCLIQLSLLFIISRLSMIGDRLWSGGDEYEKSAVYQECR